MEVYLKEIMDTLPKKENGKWYMRPHHLETVTKHPKSIKGDLFNVNYFSHNNLDHGKEEQPVDAEECVGKIEEHLLKLRGAMQDEMRKRGQDPDKAFDKLYGEVGRDAAESFKNFISDRTRVDQKQLIVKAYEDILNHKRKGERDLLNKKRLEEFEKNRPTQDGWHGKKDKGFHKEMYRNRVADGKNGAYLDKLQDKHLY